MEKITTLNDAFIFMLKRLYFSEQEIHRMMPDFIEQVSPSLQEQLRSYQETEQRKINRFHEVFEFLKEPVMARKNEIIIDLLHETKDRLQAASEEEGKDVLLVQGVRIINHYKISDYRTCYHFAEELNESLAMEVLAEILELELLADQELGKVEVIELQKAS